MLLESTAQRFSEPAFKEMYKELIPSARDKFK